MSTPALLPSGGRPQPQRLLLTLLGDHWDPAGGALPSAFLVRLLGELGMSAPNARATVSRVARRGLLEPSRRGRRTFYRVTERGAELLEEGYRRIFEFGSEPAPWDGSWTIVAFSVPEARRDTRHLLRTRLRWHGFAPLQDAVWAAVGDQSAAASDILAALDVRSATVMTGRVCGPPDGQPITAWRLDELGADYRAFIDGCLPVRARAVSGQISPTEALRFRSSLIDEWRMFRAKDPDLPDQLLPADWPRDAARELFLDLVGELGPLAALRVGQLLAPDGPDLTRFVTHRSARVVPVP